MSVFVRIPYNRWQTVVNYLQYIRMKRSPSIKNIFIQNEMSQKLHIIFFTFLYTSKYIWASPQVFIIQKTFSMSLQFQDIKPETIKLQSGCYVVNPDILKNHPKKFVLAPLKSAQYQIEIVNSIANVTLIQTYQNPTNKYLQLEYKFPINPNSCIYRFIAQFSNNRIEGVVKQKQQAHKQYKQAVKKGKRAAYGSLNTDSKDIFKLEVGNLAPGQQVKIQLVYFQQLSLSNNVFYQLHMIGTISPKYMKFLPPAAIQQGLRNQKAKVQGKFFWNFKITLKTSRKTCFFGSNTHDIQLVSQNGLKTESVIAMTKACTSNKDFIFRYTTQDYQLPSYVFGRTDVGSTAMISFIPKFCSLSIDDAYKASVAGKNVETDIQNAKGEYVFLLDRSGSMGGQRIQMAKQALILFIKSLPQDTYFNVLGFGTDYQSMFQQSVKYNDPTINTAVNKVKTMSADLGGTQIFQPLSKLLDQKIIQGYPRQIFLLTDGGVSDTEMTIQKIGMHNKHSRVHTIGIGNGCSERLILGCAQKGKGYHVFINDDENPEEKIIQLLNDSLSPVISKFKLNYDFNLVQSIIPNPQSCPYILKNEIVNFYITFKGQLSQPTRIEFCYEDSLNKMPYASEIQIYPQNAREPFIDKMGHFKKIRLMQQSYKNNSNLYDMMYYVKKIDKKGQIIKQSVKHQILSQFTAFVCIEKELVDGKYQEIQEAGKSKIQIIGPKPAEYQSKKRGRALKNYVMYSSSNSSSSSSHEYIDQCYMQTIRSSNRLKNKMKKRTNLSQKANRKIIQQSSQQQEQAILQCGRFQMSQMVDQSASCQKQCLSLKGKTIILQRLESANLRTLSKNSTKQGNPQNSELKNILSISDIISHQSSEGSWEDLNLIGTLLGKEVKQKIAGQLNLVAIITYLVAKWIEKHYPAKKYNLVVKKGLNYVKKVSQNSDQFSKLYDQYLQ